jgi:hypothetical protein
MTSTVAPDPNRYSWQGIYSWSEPICGSRLEWRNDRFRFVKLALIPSSIFGVAAFYKFWTSAQVVVWLSIISGALVGYLWLLTFLPRQVDVFDDRITFRRPLNRNVFGISIYFSDIKNVDLDTVGAIWRISLVETNGERAAFFTRDKEMANGIVQLINHRAKA